MKYLMTIIRYEENKNYEAEMAKWKEDNAKPWIQMRDVPSKEIPGRAIEVHLTEDEYKKVKGEVIKIFE